MLSLEILEKIICEIENLLETDFSRVLHILFYSTVNSSHYYTEETM